VLVPVAHAGHWLPYVVPAAVVLVAVIIATLRERGRERPADAAEVPEEDWERAYDSWDDPEEERREG
jgi:hypothetical protein